jgi:lexA DNA binding domain|nr:MAG TPA: LexA DNA binding domain [Caudoviricetes sp.]
MHTTEHGAEVRKKIKKAIIWYIEQHGYAPTVREIGEMVGLSSTSSVQII